MEPLHGVQVLLFDVFGTVVDWHGSIVDELRSASRGTRFHNEGVWFLSSQLTQVSQPPADWDAFANEWRAGYIRTTSAPICVFSFFYSIS